MNDIYGRALLDYFHGKYTEDIITETNISEEDVLPLPYLFRSYSEMPPLEQKALQLSKGRILDVGCGTGSHSLYLQNKGMEVTAIDTSPGAVEVCQRRGLKDVRHTELLQFKDKDFDTILLLMNGTGIFETLENIPEYLQHVKSLLAKNGQILIDSSDLQYMYDRNEEGGLWVPADRYYGELEFTMTYKGVSSPPFFWLYLDELRFEEICTSEGLKFEVITRGENYDYLARITVDCDSPS
ncbi:class I SAM-dependent methyltransferase [Constantimarinum furrinae]|uniref:Methyltransferase n=1 Tax=Constantimarinum furrinae TaxID=2562285 RepID=A0A7G8PV76_9FLAO|nr:class I SAM-dependent methyltransferase [Constantimarinum furrinae]QNJ98242.1 methyltransferase [Constantimarinum furrinae]